MLNLNLMAASVLAQAAEVYRRAMIAIKNGKEVFEDIDGSQKNATREMKNLEKFFKSPWAESLMQSAGLNGSPAEIIRRFHTVDVEAIGDIWEDFENSFDAGI